VIIIFIDRLKNKKEGESNKRGDNQHKKLLIFGIIKKEVI
jgi:hypothetical protein